MNAKEIDADKTMIKLSLPMLAGMLGFMGSFLTGIIIFGITTKSTAEAAVQRVSAVELDVKDYKTVTSNDIRAIRDSQIRIETRLGLKPPKDQ